jgi:membrane-bound lytic murein transglycosylase B
MVPFLLFIVMVPFSPFAHSDPIGEISIDYQRLIHRLSQDGFDPKFIINILTDSRVELIPSFMTLSLNSVEKKELYDRFLSPESIGLSKKFLQENRNFLSEIEKEHHVDKEVIVAILFVESRFGENIGKYRVFSTLVSRALTDTQDNLNKNYDLLQKMNPGLSYEWLEGWSKRKATWAYHELKCFLKIIQDEKMDPLEVHGSSFGALGMAQFIPSSYLTFAISQKGLAGWLFSKEEAISSIANYLKSHGWEQKLPLKKKRQILWYYNRSIPYVETILKIAQKIKH